MARHLAIVLRRKPQLPIARFKKSYKRVSGRVPESLTRVSANRLAGWTLLWPPTTNYSSGEDPDPQASTTLGRELVRLRTG